MSALTILIIRHAEKPDGAWPGPGTAADGTDDDASLVIRGWQRAGSWCALFGAGLSSGQFPQPGVIYAANPKATPGPNISQRPFETITPLAARLGKTPVTTYGVGQEKGLVTEISGLTGVVLVCWEHHAIGDSILPGLTGDQTLPEKPTKWSGKRFDVVLRLDRSMPGAPWSFRQLFPRLLSGDTDDPMK